jgi:hypothetical protein
MTLPERLQACARWQPKGRRPQFKSFGQLQCQPGQDPWDVALPVAQEWFRHRQGGGCHANHRAIVQGAFSAVVRLWTDQGKGPKADRLKRFLTAASGTSGTCLSPR